MVEAIVLQRGTVQTQPGRGSTNLNVQATTQKPSWVSNNAWRYNAVPTQASYYVVATTLQGSRGPT